MMDSWRPLECECGAGAFVEVKALAWKPKGGTTANTRGYYCINCHTIADMQKLTNKAQYEQKSKELEAMKAEIASMEGA
jgi:hypothetical protein